MGNESKLVYSSCVCFPSSTVCDAVCEQKIIHKQKYKIGELRERETLRGESERKGTYFGNGKTGAKFA